MHTRNVGEDQQGVTPGLQLCQGAKPCSPGPSLSLQSCYTGSSTHFAQKGALTTTAYVWL